jgi:hypothetical protein
MRLAAFAAAAAVLGTGCYYYDEAYVAPPPGYANVFWAFRRAAPAQPGGFVIYDASYAAVDPQGVCPESAVDHVTVSWLGGSTTVECTGPVGPGSGGTVQWSQGVTLPPLPPGSWDLTVSGWRQGWEVYRSGATAVIYADRATDVLVDVFGVPAPVEIYADLAGGDPPIYYASCAEAFSPNIGYELWDSFGTLVDEGLAGCGDPLPSLAYQDLLDLDNYTVRLRGYALAGGAQVFDACDAGFDHFGSQLGDAGVYGILYTAPMPVCP